MSWELMSYGELMSGGTNVLDSGRGEGREEGREWGRKGGKEEGEEVDEEENQAKEGDQE